MKNSKNKGKGLNRKQKIVIDIVTVIIVITVALLGYSFRDKFNFTKDNNVENKAHQSVENKNKDNNIESEATSDSFEHTPWVYMKLQI